MKRYEWIGWLGILLLGVCNAGAGARVLLRLEQRSVLLFEPVNAFISLANDSDEPFVLNSRQPDNGRSSLVIEVRRDNQLLPPRGSAPVPYLYLLPDDSEELMVDLSRHFDFTGMGRYFIKVRTSHLGEAFESKGQLLDVVKGFELTKRARSVPGQPDRMLTFSLRYWSRDGKEFLFLTVNEEVAGANYGLFNLGPLVRVAQPVLQVNRNGQVVVVHQSGVRRFTRSTLQSETNGVTLLDQTYHLPDGSPYPSFTRRSTVAPTPAERLPPKRWWQFWKKDGRAARPDAAAPAPALES